MTAIKRRLFAPAPSWALAVFRIVFGVLMLISTLRFIGKGWIKEFYIDPTYHFTFYGFDWVKPLSEHGMVALYVVMAALSVMISIGAFYRVSLLAFFLIFTYVELIDITFYLNHYYFVSVLSFLLLWLPLNARWSMDTWLWPNIRAAVVPRWTILAIQGLLALVYFYAGVAKLQPDWLARAMPMAIWLPVHTDFPVVGRYFEDDWVHFAFSWAGAAYDLTIPLWLWWRPTRPFAYVAVIVFHVMTGMLFNIGMFPWIMIGCTLIFFAPLSVSEKPSSLPYMARLRPYHAIVIAFFAVQILLPLRHWLYPGDLLWTEEGYRLSWRVMLVEKAGYTVFRVHDPDTDRTWTVYPSDLLTPQQAHQMSFQPDMILSFAHFLNDYYRQRGRGDVAVYAEAYVSWNGRRSTLLIDPTVDLAHQRRGFMHKWWLEDRLE